MKKTVIALTAMICAFAMTTQAADEKKEKKKMTEEQRKVMKELTDKYDANKDGKLDKDERAKMSADDKEKAEKAGMGKKKDK